MAIRVRYLASFAACLAAALAVAGRSDARTEWIRGHLGGTVYEMGWVFDPWDFAYYAAGCLLAAWLAGRLARPETATVSGSTS